MKRSEGGGTDLRPDHLGEGADELGRGVAVAAHGFLVDDLADGEPERGLEALGMDGQYGYE